MHLLIVMPNRDQNVLQQAIVAIDPSLGDVIQLWPDLQQSQDIGMAVLWQHPEQLLTQLPRLQLAQSFGAGVEHILQDANLRHSTRVARIAGPKLSASMADYLRKHVAKNQLMENAQTHIGLLGYGELGMHVAQALLTDGYEVSAYARHRPDDAAIKLYINAELSQMLAQCDFLICLLPLTAQTRNMLNIHLFQQCKPGCWLINVGRGKHLLENDLLVALEEGYLRGATLDVTRQEPVPDEHPFQRHASIELTHHTASLTDWREAAQVIVENYHRLQNNQALLYAVDRAAGY